MTTFFPVGYNTFQGVPNPQANTGNKWDVMRILDGDAIKIVTLTCTSGNVVITPPTGVSDWELPGDCTAITTTCNAVLSKRVRY